MIQFTHSKIYLFYLWVNYLTTSRTSNQNSVICKALSKLWLRTQEKNNTDLINGYSTIPSKFLLSLFTRIRITQMWIEILVQDFGGLFAEIPSFPSMKQWKKKKVKSDTDLWDGNPTFTGKLLFSFFARIRVTQMGVEILVQNFRGVLGEIPPFPSIKKEEEEEKRKRTSFIFFLWVIVDKTSTIRLAEFLNGVRPKQRGELNRFRNEILF